MRISKGLVKKITLFSALLTVAALFLLFGPPALLEKSESPEFCAACHVMLPQYAAWSHNVHRYIRCVDCHLPNDNQFNHFLWKGIDGTKDVVFFTIGRIPDPIRLSPHGSRFVQANCISCHKDMFANMDKQRRCWDCHRQQRHTHTGVIWDIHKP